MVLRDERMAGGSVAGRLLLASKIALANLFDEVQVGSPQLACIGLVSLALVCATLGLSAPGHLPPITIGIMSVLVSALTLCCLALSFAATLPLSTLLSRQRRQMLGGVGLVALGILSIAGLWNGGLGLRSAVQGAAYSNDGAVMDLYAARQVLEGRDPYVTQNIVPALAAINAPSTTTTPLMDGQFRGASAYPSPQAVQQVFLNVLLHRPRTIPPEFESKYNYPAGSFLFILPFAWMGMNDMRFLYILAVVLTGAYLFQRMPRGLKPLAPLLMLANVPLMVLTAGGQPDPVYGLFLLIGFAEWPRRRVSPFMMGLAVATKQLAWFFLPLYILWIVRQFGWREAMRRSRFIAAIFAVVNLPFILHAPAAYLASISGPMTDPMFPLGMGIIAIFVSNFLPMLPKAVFSVAELLAWIGSSVAVARYRIVSLAGCAALGALPLFFAWRSLVNYFYLVPLLALAVVLADSDRRVRQSQET